MRNFLLGLAVGAVLFTGASWATDKAQIVPLNELYEFPQDIELTVPAFQLLRAECYARNSKTGELEPIEFVPR